MGELFVALLANPVVRAFLEGLVLDLVADIIHRRSTDPDFLEKSDQCFAALSAAKTDEDRLNAQKDIQSLLAS